MHRYLRSIGFSNYHRNKEYREVLKKIIRFSDSKKYVSGDNEIIWAEYRKEFAPGIGIAVCGEYNEDNEFEYEYSFPYYESDKISSSEQISFERHLDKDSFAGICEEYKVGVSLIFYLQNRMDYLKELMRKDIYYANTSVSLTGMCVDGMIVLPLNKNEKQIKQIRKKSIQRSQLMQKAKAGDEKAIESLTLDDMDKFNIVSKKMFEQDVFTLVDTYFMPYGAECDLYSVMGEIEDARLVTNSLTNEEIYIISIVCNDLNFDVCINKKDLIGEPAARRRFKGVVWLQGHVNF